MKRPYLHKFLQRAVTLLSVLFAISAGIIVWDGLTDEIAVSDIAVVLGSKVETDGMPSERLKARLDKTLGLYEKGWFPRIIVSGGMGKEGYDEALIMRSYLVEHGIPEENVIVDSSGKNTYFTAKKSARLMTTHGWKSALVISQYFHISRSRLALQRFGVPHVYSAHADYYEIRDIYSLGREVIAYAYYLLRGYQD
jgi:vancomycin permeability regulator SanA